MRDSNYLVIFWLAVSAAACGDPATEGDISAGGTGATGGAAQAGKGGGNAAGQGGTQGQAGSATSSGGSSGTGVGGAGGTGGVGTSSGGAGTAGTSAGAPATGGMGTGGAPMTGGAGGVAAGGAGAGGTLGGAGNSAGGSAGIEGTGGTAGAGGGAGGSGGMAAGAGGGGMAGKGGAGGAGTGGGAGKAGSGGSAGTGSCDAPPAASPLVGWASVSGNSVTTTTGGGNATPVTVTTLSEFSSAVSGTNAAVIYVKGTLSAGKVNIGSNKTIAGICGAELHGHLELNGSVNVIIRNIKFVGYGVGNCALDPDYDSGTGCSSGNDGISVQKNAHHIWFDHCDISDGTDGNLDITNAANYVTVSWTRFHYTARTDNEGDDSTGAAGHRYSNLIGGTDSPSSYDDANALNVTWHHNQWGDHVVERQARVRFGRNHFFNNLWSSGDTNYCIRAGKQARILVENSVFDSQNDPMQFNNSTDQGTANITATGNDYTDSSGSKDTGGGGSAIGTLPYSYSADPVSGVAASVLAGVGPK